MMVDGNVVGVSPSSTYRVLKAAGLLQRWNPKRSRKGNSFQQPLEPHEHWHVDVSYLNIAGTFFYLCSVLDGCSCFLLHWELRTAMTIGPSRVNTCCAARRAHPPSPKLPACCRFRF